MSKTLQLQFEAANGKGFLLSVDDPKSDLTQAEVEAGMQTIILNNAFQVDGDSLTTIKTAKVVERNVNNII